MSELIVQIVEERIARGDIGPCEHLECPRRASASLEFIVADVTAYTWLCTEHVQELNRL